jgi:hypothetical protein
MQNIMVNLRNAEEVAKLRGHGISCIPKEHQMKYVPVSVLISSEFLWPHHRLFRHDPQKPLRHPQKSTIQIT